MADRTPLESAERHVDNAKWAALFSAGVTVIFATISLGGEPVAGIDAWAFLDVALILGLAFGLSRKSRACAAVLLVYFIASKVLIWKEAGNVRGLPVALLFTWYFAMGVVGTFRYHALEASAAQSRQPAYRPAGASRGNPWLAWTILAGVILAGAGGAWYLKAARVEAQVAANQPTQADIEAAAASGLGRLNSLGMSGKAAALSAAISVDERIMLAPCHGITPDVHLFVKLDSRELKVQQLEPIEPRSGLCRITLKEGGSYPLRMSTAGPKVGEAVFAARFDAEGKVRLARAQVTKVTPGPGGSRVESSAASEALVEGSPLLDANGAVIAILLDGQHTTPPPAWSALWPAR